MNHLEHIKSKIHSIESIKNTIVSWKYFDKKIVFTNGCFDIIHLGHIEYLAKAASLGSILIVGINSDASISRIKGPTRPIINEDSRIHTIAALGFVDIVIPFDEETPYNLIHSIIPDILVKGNDYKAEDIIGYDIVTQNGGVVKTIELTQGFSTTNVVEKIKSMK